MAVGFTPKHVEELPLGGLTQEQFLALANDTANEMGWRVDHLSDSGMIAYTNRGMFSWNALIKVKIAHDTANIRSESTGNEMMDWGKNKKNVRRFMAALETLRSGTTPEALDARYQELKEQLVPPEEDVLTLPPQTAGEQLKGFFSIFVPREGFFITPILIDLNILLFILMTASGVNILQPDNESLLRWGANFRPLTLDGEWWRLITNCFLHIGILHLLLNMYALLYIGLLLEPHLGKIRFLTAYLLTGITASIASLWWHDLMISAGASGAIFGMYGVFLAMLTTSLIEKTSRKALLASIGVFVGYNLLFGLKGGIDNAAHIGGLLGGIVIGYGLIPSLKRPGQQGLKFGTLGLLAVLMLAGSFAIYKKIPNDTGIYDTRIKEFATLEKRALEVFSLPENAPKDTVLYALKEKGIDSWNQCISLLGSFDKMDLPAVIQTRNKLLKEYCALRIKSYELIYRSVSENTDQYNARINDYNTQIEAKIKEVEQESK